MCAEEKELNIYIRGRDRVNGLALQRLKGMGQQSSVDGISAVRINSL